MNKNIFLSLIAASACVSDAWAQVAASYAPPAAQAVSAVTVPLGGNTWKNRREGGTIGNDGVTNWTDAATVYNVYIRPAATGTVQLSLRAKVPAGKSRIQITSGGRSADIELQGAEMKNYKIGSWKINDTGYMRIAIKGISKEGSVFADMESMEADGSAIDAHTAFIKDNSGNFFHWGRRGPSVHLGYIVPDNIPAEWFYNEITVPQGQDVVGSYFMAAGFAEGYFGIQVNSETERRILFSVWSPFSTDNPKEIPDDQKIRMLKKGEGVHTGEFGNEGSGGQSYLRYMWKAGTTYKFLLHAKPGNDNYTTYTAYFFEPGTNKWMVVASFMRPKTATYIKRPHSFLENFNPEKGDVERRVMFSNQWIKDTTGNWIELTRARFTGDNTAVKGYRMDYGGGVSGSSFFLRNCGFFRDYTKLNSILERKTGGKHPDIDFNALP